MDHRENFIKERKSEGTMKKNQRISFIIEQRRGGERSLSMIFMAEDFDEGERDITPIRSGKRSIYFVSMCAF